MLKAENVRKNAGLAPELRQRHDRRARHGRGEHPWCEIPAKGAKRHRVVQGGRSTFLPVEIRVDGERRQQQGKRGRQRAFYDGSDRAPGEHRSGEQRGRRRTHDEPPSAKLLREVERVRGIGGHGSDEVREARETAGEKHHHKRHAGFRSGDRRQHDRGQKRRHRQNDFEPQKQH